VSLDHVFLMTTSPCATHNHACPLIFIMFGIFSGLRFLCTGPLDSHTLLGVHVTHLFL
jgi:hypothetical protein